MYVAFPTTVDSCVDEQFAASPLALWFLLLKAGVWYPSAEDLVVASAAFSLPTRYARGGPTLQLLRTPYTGEMTAQLQTES